MAAYAPQAYLVMLVFPVDDLAVLDMHDLITIITAHRSPISNNKPAAAHCSPIPPNALHHGASHSSSRTINDIIAYYPVPPLLSGRHDNEFQHSPSCKEPPIPGGSSLFYKYETGSRITPGCDLYASCSQRSEWRRNPSLSLARSRA